MEHLLHFFGGGCGEHLILPAIASSITGCWVYCKCCLTKKRGE